MSENRKKTVNKNKKYIVVIMNSDWEQIILSDQVIKYLRHQIGKHYGLENLNLWQRLDSSN